MSARFREGFDWTTTAADLSKKWSGSLYLTGIGTNYGRFAGSIGITLNSVSSTIWKSLDSQPTWVIGFACRFSFPSSNGFLLLNDNGTLQLTLRLNPNGTLSVVRGSTVLGVTTFTLQAMTWYYIELKVTIHPTAGVAELRIDGVSRLSLTGQNTRATANNSVDSFIFATVSGLETHLDDIYINDGQGAAHNDFEGDSRIITLLPSGAGAASEWAPSAGSNYACVDEAAPNGDTDYVAAATAGLKDTYAMADLAGTPTIRDVSVNLIARKDDAGLNQCIHVLRSGGTDYESADTLTLSSSYVNYQKVYGVDPNGDAPWDASRVNALEAGIKRMA